MTPEAQRIAIAEVCGFTILKDEQAQNGCLWGGRKDRPLDRPIIVPDYLNDLNAMNEAEKSLLEDQIGAYYDNLSAISDDLAFMAIAAQRAEAFLKTIGKLTC